MSVHRDARAWPPAPAVVVERMSRVDTAWLRMDNAANLMMIVGVLLVEPALTLQALRERVRQRLLCYPRFLQRVEHDAVGALWVPDEDFDLDRHVWVATPAREPGWSDRRSLQHYCGLLTGVPLDSRHPLWEFQLIERHEGGSAVVVRVHHCIADGIALVQVLLSLTDEGAPPPRRWRMPSAAEDVASDASTQRKAPGAEPPSRDGEDWLSEAVLRPFTEVALRTLSASGDSIRQGLGAGLKWGAEAAHDPQRSAQAGRDAALDVARAGWHVMQDVAALALMADDDPTALKGTPLGVKHVAWGDPLPLAEVKAVGKALGCSVNDVLLSCAAGAVGQWLRQARGETVRGKAIRAMVPVNLRPLDKAWQLGNRFGLAPLELPIGLDNPVQRVHDVRRRMAQLKSSTQPLLAYALLSVSGLFVKPVQDSLLNLFARKATAVMTNVPGPAQALSLCGRTLKQPLFWVPSSGDIGVGLSILSYGGGVHFGLMTDEQLCPEPQEIVAHFAEAFEQLLLITLMLPCADELEDGSARMPAAVHA